MESAASSRLTSAREITREVVGILKERTGRGPVSAHSYVHEHVVLVVMADGHTAVEQTLLDAGQAQEVADSRSHLLQVLKPELIAAVERTTGRKVIGFMAGSQQDPDLLSHVYVLEPLLQAIQPAE